MNILITQTNDIAGGHPRIQGTGIKVATIVDLVLQGMSYGEIISDFPSLNKNKILAALEYATENFRQGNAA